MDALPYYKWLWRDWRANRRVQRMPWQARGLYRELLDEFWSEGSLPVDPVELADICGCTVAEFEQFWPFIEPCWQERESRLYNSKMSEQRTAKDAERIAKAESGSIGGKKSNSHTRHEGLEADAKQVLEIAKEMQAQPDIAEQSNSRAEQEHSQLRPIPLQREPDTDEVEAIRMAYPRRVKPIEARRSIQKAVSHLRSGKDRPAMSTSEALAFLMSAVTKYARSSAGKQGEFTPYPATWFNGGSYLEDETEWDDVRSPQGTRAAGVPVFENALETMRRERGMTTAVAQ